MANKSYYDVLGVSKNASDSEIKSAYRNLQKKYHPDLQNGKSDAEKKEAEQKAKEVNEAYDVLSDKNKRANYDRFGTTEGMGAGFGGGHNPSSFFHGDDDFFGFGSFASMFRNSSNSNGNKHTFDKTAPKDGVDFQFTIDITLKEYIFGKHFHQDVTIEDVCPECYGTGAKNAEHETCKVCEGSGVVEEHINPMFMRRTTCHACGGTGISFIPNCPHCKGKGHIHKSKTYDFDIPAGLSFDVTLRVPYQGESGLNGGKNGDAYFGINIIPNNLFEILHGRDLKTRIYISPVTATLGGNVEVFTPYGYEKILIPQGTTSGQIITINDKGLPFMRSNKKGNLLVEVIVDAFINLSKEQVQTLKNIDNELNNDKHLKHLKGYKDSVKNFR